MKYFSVLLFCIYLIFYSHLAYSSTEDLYAFPSIDQANRFKSLVKEIRCVVCQYQTIDDSTAPLAIDLRGKVYQLVKAKKTDQEIKSYLVKRYGEFILLQPRLNLSTLLLWFFPILGIIMVFVTLFIFIKSSI